MTMIEIKLPDEVAQRARSAGLLSDSAIQHLLEDAMRRRSGRALLGVARDIQDAGIPPMSMDDIDAEVKAFRAERRAGKVGGSLPGSESGVMRAVLDTNVVVSALIWGGKPLALLQAATDGDLLLNTSTVLLEELSGVLARLHLAARLERRRFSVEQAIALYAGLTEIIEPPPLPVPVSRDPDDDAVLALAAAARPDFVVSGDHYLLVLGAYADIPIITPAQALVMLTASLQPPARG